MVYSHYPSPSPQLRQKSIYLMLKENKTHSLILTLNTRKKTLKNISNFAPFLETFFLYPLQFSGPGYWLASLPDSLEVEMILSMAPNKYDSDKKLTFVVTKTLAVLYYVILLSLSIWQDKQQVTLFSLSLQLNTKIILTTKSRFYDSFSLYLSHSPSFSLKKRLFCLKFISLDQNYL